MMKNCRVHILEDAVGGVVTAVQEYVPAMRNLQMWNNGGTFWK